MSGAETPLLELRQVDAGYGDIQILHGIDLSIASAETVCLIGSNGAGKSTLLNTISGLIVPRRGSVRIGGTEMAGRPPRDIVAAGIIQVPEGRRLFAGMTVRENLLLGAFLRRDGAAATRRALDFVFATFPRLADRAGQDAATMSGGEQQMCAIGRGIMAAPKLLLIDELSLGLAPKIVEEIAAALRGIVRQGVSLLIVEQDVMTALEMTERGLVLDEGRVRLGGPSTKLMHDPSIRTAYLGFDAADPLALRSEAS